MKDNHELEEKLATVMATLAKAAARKEVQKLRSDLNLRLAAIESTLDVLTDDLGNRLSVLEYDACDVEPTKHD